MGFPKSEVDPNLYLIQVGEDPLILVLYVDDLFLTGVEKLIASCKRDLASEFEMKDIGFDALLLGIEGVAAVGRDLPRTWEVCSRDI
jgi:hypothetical protein